MHLRAVKHTIRGGLCTHHAAWVNHTENRCRRLKDHLLRTPAASHESPTNTATSTTLAQNMTVIKPTARCIRQWALVVGSPTSSLITCSYPTSVSSCYFGILLLRGQVGEAAFPIYATSTKRHNSPQEGVKRTERGVVRNYPISAHPLYLFCLVLFLLAAALSALSLWAALRNGDEALAWISAACFAITSLLAILFWRLL